ALPSAPALQTFDSRPQDIERQIRRVWAVYRENPAAHEHSAALTGRLKDIAEELGHGALTYDEGQSGHRQPLHPGRALAGEPQLLEVASPNHRADGDRTVEEKPMTT